MILWITLGVMVIGIIGVIFIDTWSDWWTVASVISCITGIAIFFMSLHLIVEYAGVESYVERMNARYEMLTYQYENNFYDNDNDVGKYELIQEIQEWNEDLAARKISQYNFWYGIFIPDIYDQFEFINLTGVANVDKEEA